MTSVDMIHFWIFTFCFLGIIGIHDAAKTIGPVGNIIINSVYGCEDKIKGDDVVLTAELKSIDDKGTKALFSNLKTKIPLDNTIEFNIDVFKSEAGGWKKFYNYRGKFCVDLQKHIPKLYDRLRKEMKPSIAQPCPIKAGNYVLEKFQASTKDFPIPAIFYGDLKVKISVTKNKKLLTCVMGEGTSQAPGLKI